jgi:MFS family permease
MAGSEPHFRRARAKFDFRLLRDFRVRRLTLAQFTSAAGDGMVLAALPFAIKAGGGSDAEFSLALAVQALAMAFFLPPAGVFGDRLNRRRVIVAADLLRFGARGAFAVLLILGDAALWQLLVAQAVQGAGTALFSTAMDGFVPEVVEGEKRLQKLNALRSLAFSSGFAFGPAIGGLVYLAAGASGAFAVDALTFLASAALIARLPASDKRRASNSASLRALAGDVAEGWRAFRQIRWYWRVASEFAALNALVFAPYFVIGPHVAEESLGGAAAWATILVALGVGELIGALVVIAWEPKRPLLTATSLVAVWVLPLLLLAWVAPVVLLATGAVVAGIAIAVFDALWETAKQTHTPPHLRARLGSFDHLGSLALVPFGYMLGAVMLGAVGAEATLIGAAAILAAVTLVLSVDPNIRGFRRLDEIPGEGLSAGPPRPGVAAIRVVSARDRRTGGRRRLAATGPTKRANGTGKGLSIERAGMGTTPDSGGEAR